MAFDVGPPRDCRLCPRLAEFRRDNRAEHPGLVERAGRSPSAIRDARLLIVGLAPGLRGANRTGRPVHRRLRRRSSLRDLARIRLRRGRLRSAAGRRPAAAGLRDRQRRALRSAAEQADAAGDRRLPPLSRERDRRRCRKLRAVVALGRIAHDSALRALGRRLAAHPFAHGARHDLGAGAPVVFDSYHCSRYNTNTGVLTPEMFRAALAGVRRYLESSTDARACRAVGLEIALTSASLRSVLRVRQSGRGEHERSRIRHDRRRPGHGGRNRLGGGRAREDPHLGRGAARPRRADAQRRCSG